jgi:hypothetical protein
MTLHHRKQQQQQQQRTTSSSSGCVDPTKSLIQDNNNNHTAKYNDSTVPSRLASDVSEDNGTWFVDDYDKDAKGKIDSKAATIQTEPLLLASSSTSFSRKRRSSSRLSSSSSVIVSRSWNTWTTHVARIFTEFQHNGLPWEGQQCRSIQAGCSGIFFSGVAWFISNKNNNDNNTESTDNNNNDPRILLLQMAWALQGIISVLADYVYIPYTSIWHGMDRISATLLLLISCSQVLQSLAWWMTLIGIGPVACFVQAAHAKQERNLQKWHVWHCAWHLVASSVTMFLMYLLYQYCPSINDTTTNGGVMEDHLPGSNKHNVILEEWFGRPACQSKNSVMGIIVGWWEFLSSF